MNVRRLAFICTLLLVFILVGCGSANKAEEGATDNDTGAATEHVEALAIYKQQGCITCHGTDLGGKMGAKTNLKKAGANSSAEEIEAQIRNGGGGMPAYADKMSDDEIILVTDWLASLK